jgi:hypothetical protein
MDHATVAQDVAAGNKHRGITVLHIPECHRIHYAVIHKYACRITVIPSLQCFVRPGFTAVGGYCFLVQEMVVDELVDQFAVSGAGWIEVGYPVGRRACPRQTAIVYRSPDGSVVRNETGIESTRRHANDIGRCRHIDGRVPQVLPEEVEFRGGRRTKPFNVPADGQFSEVEQTVNIVDRSVRGEFCLCSAGHGVAVNVTRSNYGVVGEADELARVSLRNTGGCAGW